MNDKKLLCLHSGGQHVARGELIDAPTPEPTDTHHPIPHFELVNQTVDHLSGLGVGIAEEDHGLSHEGNRYFGMFRLDLGHADYSLVVGLRNSHDKAFAAGLSLGSNVFVCDNLAFSGEVKIARKHTRFISRDLPRLMSGAVNRIMDQRGVMDARIAAYKETELHDAQVHDMLIRSLDAKIVGATKVPLVLKEWRKPSHEEFASRTAWSLFNSFTEVLKGYNTDSVYRRSPALHGLFDSVCMLAS